MANDNVDVLKQAIEYLENKGSYAELVDNINAAKKKGK
jgi:hypothetical protein